ncbi:FadR/GntR family transcriptional regulator [Sporosarcina pasteurii]|uniref:L-lactate utilization operon repressor n=1 Tax=Sporosarcina pasteurii TaxID=1474 RepID=A0A380C674_SPOPA|nr:GntR family transcriptional regulator [Sporosarcina pasteurii]MDS9471741.1 GntR family transcriptional regulator [Sporosarcina pasteurii]QBQ04661.1 FadR family transcriptional regulator [Sporosarcina pasteurii]SUJ12946.1 L-lactate utilization operon repressor [Sporosarcina pasteurii]
MESQKEHSKMYLEIVRELRNLIEEENIKTGGKLPSERVLAERMQAGRSTVREALRSLELLGVIETRRGEGTFLADLQKNQFVDVLSGFILQQSTSIRDVQETRRIHEIAAIQTVCQRVELRKLPVWESLLAKVEYDESMKRIDLIREMIVSTGNRLSLKIWRLLKQFSQVPYDMDMTPVEKQYVKELLVGIVDGDEAKTLKEYNNWIKLVEDERGE